MKNKVIFNHFQIVEYTFSQEGLIDYWTYKIQACVTTREKILNKWVEFPQIYSQEILADREIGLLKQRQRDTKGENITITMKVVKKNIT